MSKLSQKQIALALCFLLPAVGLVSAQTPAPAVKTQPNILFILTDDLGYGDLSISGNPIVKTPNIDDLARHSIICTNGYAAYPICMPSRISILSGKYSDRTGARMNTDRPGPPKLDQPWLPALLKTAGYTTCAIGKWHLGGYSPVRAKAMGFDTWALPIGAWWHYFNFTINRPDGVKDVITNRYSTDVLTHEAIKFIGQNHTRPFFLYLAYNAPHFPLEAPDEEIAPFRHRPDVNSGAAVVYAMVQHLDRKIGELIAYLKANGLYDNTIIVFTSDNGPEFSTYKGLNQKRWNADLAGWKGRVLEGGIKVPVFISWPAAFGDHPKPFNGVVDGVDWQPTLSAAAGVTVPPAPVDGVNLLPRLLGKSHDPIPARYWNYNTIRPTMLSNGALREGDWKLVRPAIEEFSQWGRPADFPLPEKIPDYQLFNIAQDPGEKQDLAGQQPERVARMKAEYEQIYQDVESGPDNAGHTGPPTPSAPLQINATIQQHPAAKPATEAD